MAFALAVLFLLFVIPNCQAYQFIIGEELTYNVMWMHVRLGTATIQVYDSLKMNNQKLYHVKFFLESNPLLFFINMQGKFECYVDENFKPYLFRSVEKVDDISCDSYYRFDYHDSLIYVRIVDRRDSTRVIEKSIPLNNHVLDGISLIFYIRSRVDVPNMEQLTVIAGGEKKLLDLKISDRRKKIRINSRNLEFDTFEIEGKAHFTSTAGVTGKFRAWFATDQQKPPMVAELKVFIGNVKLILESWKNWDPEPEKLTER